MWSVLMRSIPDTKPRRTLMSTTTGSTNVATVGRPNLIRALFPSVVSGIILGVIGAAVAGVIVNALTKGGNQDASVAAVYTGWTLFFFVGIGAFDGVLKWGFARREATYAEELQLAGKDQGIWRYFRYTTDHKVVGIQYLATVFVLFFLGSIGAFMLRLEQSTPGAIYF